VAIHQSYDAFGLIGATFRKLDWKARIFFERAAPISPNAWHDDGRTAQMSRKAAVSTSSSRRSRPPRRAAQQPPVGSLSRMPGPPAPASRSAGATWPPLLSTLCLC
jgi:hypothetical protein